MTDSWVQHRPVRPSTKGRGRRLPAATQVPLELPLSAPRAREVDSSEPRTKAEPEARGVAIIDFYV